MYYSLHTYFCENVTLHIRAWKTNIPTSIEFHYTHYVKFPYHYCYHYYFYCFIIVIIIPEEFLDNFLCVNNFCLKVFFLTYFLSTIFSYIY